MKGFQVTVDLFPARTRGSAATLLRHGGRRLTNTPTERAAENIWTACAGDRWCSGDWRMPQARGRYCTCRIVPMIRRTG
jgi:hypothetical protein